MKWFHRKDVGGRPEGTSGGQVSRANTGASLQAPRLNAVMCEGKEGDQRNGRKKRKGGESGRRRRSGPCPRWAHPAQCAQNKGRRGRPGSTSARPVLAETSGTPEAGRRSENGSALEREPRLCCHVSPGLWQERKVGGGAGGWGVMSW